MICKCGHDKSHHATGQGRSYWMCEYPSCECHDYDEQQHNLTVDIIFANDKTEVLIGEIEALLERHGYAKFSGEGNHLYEKVTFFPKECI